MRPDFDNLSSVQFAPQRSINEAQVRQGGFVLIISLLLLMLLTVVAVSLSRTFFLEEGISGNLREKERSFNAAQSALRYAEWWLLTQKGPFGTACGAGKILIQACSNPLVNPNILPWSTSVDYIPLDNGNPVMKVNLAGGAGNYVLTPGLYIQDMGAGVKPGTKVFLISAYGYGGNVDAVSVVQSAYEMSSSVVDLGSQQ